MTDPDRITIRPATPEDAGSYLMLVEALAVYEKMPPPDAQAKTRLIEHLFGARPYYKLLVRLDRSYVGQDPKMNPVLPGMTVLADIKTDERSVLRFLLNPVYRAIDSAFQER